MNDHSSGLKPDSSRHAPESSPTIDERASHCFGCGPSNPEGLHLLFTTDPVALTATALVQLSRSHEGPPGHIHGGIVATLLDEAMSKLNRPLNLLAMTRHIEIDYLLPAPLFTILTVRSHHLRREGRKLFHAAELLNSAGKVLARGKGLFIVIDEEMLAAAGLADVNKSSLTES